MIQVKLETIETLEQRITDLTDQVKVARTKRREGQKINRILQDYWHMKRPNGRPHKLVPIGYLEIPR